MDSKIVNRIIKKEITPFLMENQYLKISERKYLKTTDFYYFGIEIKSVGYYFSEVTGWPPQSIVSSGGIMCRLIESEFFNNSEFIKTLYKNSDFFPIAHGKHQVIIENACTLNQEKNTKNLKYKAEQDRKDLWWIDDNSKVEIIINDIKESIKNNSMNQFNNFNIGEDLIAELKKLKDSYYKYHELYSIYKSLKMKNEVEEYKNKLIEEGKRIGKKSIDL